MDDDATLSGRVLLVGKRARVLDQLSDALRQLGLSVREETDVDRVGSHIDGSNFDVVAVGRAITGSRRDELIRGLRAGNPGIRVVDGLAPITSLLVAQVEEALTSPGRDAGIVGNAALETVNSRVVVTLRRAAEARVVLHRLDMLYRAHEMRVYDGPLVRGRNYLPVKGRITHGERFLVVRAGGETSVHPIP